MEFARRRGQAAVEYLVILAVVIIIALVVVGVLGGFPQLTAGVDARQSQTYWAQADIGIVPPTLVHASSATGKLTVRNNKNFNVRMINVTGITNATAFGGFIAPGQTRTVDAAFPGCTPGATFSGTVVFAFHDTSNNVFTFTGAIPYVDTCQG